MNEMIIELKRLAHIAESTGKHHMLHEDPILAERYWLLEQQLKDAIAEMEEPGSEFEALEFALKEKHSRVERYQITSMMRIMLAIKMREYYAGRTIVEAARKMWKFYNKPGGK